MARRGSEVWTPDSLKVHYDEILGEHNGAVDRSLNALDARVTRVSDAQGGMVKGEVFDAEARAVHARLLTLENGALVATSAREGVAGLGRRTMTWVSAVSVLLGITLAILALTHQLG